MAITLNQMPQTNAVFDVVLRIDDALDMTKEEYDFYLESCDNSLLVLHRGKYPTYFRMRKVLPWELAQTIENMKLGMEQRKDGDKVSQEVIPKIAWMAEEVRVSLVDIINPQDLPEDQHLKYVRDASGGASKELVSQLRALGVLDDLYKARQSVVAPKVDKKK